MRADPVDLADDMEDNLDGRACQMKTITDREAIPRPKEQGCFKRVARKLWSILKKKGVRSNRKPDRGSTG